MEATQEEGPGSSAGPAVSHSSVTLTTFLDTYAHPARVLPCVVADLVLLGFLVVWPRHVLLPAGMGRSICSRAGVGPFRPRVPHIIAVSGALGRALISIWREGREDFESCGSSIIRDWLRECPEASLGSGVLCVPYPALRCGEYKVQRHGVLDGPLLPLSHTVPNSLWGVLFPLQATWKGWMFS